MYASASSTVFTSVNGHSKAIKKHATDINGKVKGDETIITNDKGKVKKIYKKLNKKDIGRLLLTRSKKKSTMERLMNRFLPYGPKSRKKNKNLL